MVYAMGVDNVQGWVCINLSFCLLYQISLVSQVDVLESDFIKYSYSELCIHCVHGTFVHVKENADGFNGR